MRLLPRVSALVALGLVAVGCASSDATNGTSDEVVTARCPEELSTAFSGFVADDLRAIEKASGALDASKRAQLDPALARLTALESYKADLVISGRANGECTYRAKSPEGAVSAKLYTRKSRNILRVDVSSPEAADLSFYVTLADYTTQAVTAAFPGGAVYFRGPTEGPGFEPYAIGRAGTAVVSVPTATPIAIPDGQLEADLQNAVAGVEFVSESDVPFDVFLAPLAPSEKVDAATVKTRFNGFPNTSQESFDSGATISLKNLAGQDELDYAAWIASDLQEDPTANAATQRYIQAMRQVDALLRAQCTDLKVVLVAAGSLANTHDVGFVQIFLVGRTKNGAIIAVHTAAVWT